MWKKVSSQHTRQKPRIELLVDQLTEVSYSLDLTKTTRFRSPFLIPKGLVAQAGASVGFSYSDIPDQLLRINSLEGSLATDGVVLTGVTDVSPVGGTVTVTGSPTYTATDAGLNNAPSFTIVAASKVIAPNVNRASIRFVAAVVYRSSAAVAQFLFDGDDASNRFFALVHPNGVVQVSTLATLTIPTGEASVGRKIYVAPNDNATQVRWNPSAGGAWQSIGTQYVGSASGLGLSLAASYLASAGGARLAFFMACSAVPSAPQLAALEAKLIADFG